MQLEFHILRVNCPILYFQPLLCANVVGHRFSHFSATYVVVFGSGSWKTRQNSWRLIMRPGCWMVGWEAINNPFAIQWPLYHIIKQLVCRVDAPTHLVQAFIS